MSNGVRRNKLILPKVRLSTDVYTLACERTADMLDRFDHAAVLFSGGKDSTAVLNITRHVIASDRRFERHLPLRVVFFDEEAIPIETEEYVRRVAGCDDVAVEWHCVPVRHRNACDRRSPWWWPWAPEAADRWCRPLPPEALTTLDGFPVEPAAARLSMPDTNGLLFSPDRGNCVALMGIRAEESITRARAVMRRKEINYLTRYEGPTNAGNLWKAYPIYDWLVGDVWRAAAVNGWDYNRTYDRLEMAGIGHAAQRCSPAFGEEPLEKLHTYATCFPEVWAKMVYRVPGVGAAARYARTELYAYRSRPAKPDGVTWPDYIRHYLTKYEPADAAMIAGRVAESIRRHYRIASHPICPRARHPVSGLSWDWLLTIAMRGDYKERKQPGTGLPSPDDTAGIARMWRRYVDELAGYRDRLDEIGHPRTHRLPDDLRELIPARYRDES